MTRRAAPPPFLLPPSCLLLVILLFLTFLEASQANCPKDCSQNGECSGPGEGAYCMCHMGYTGSGCETQLCPKGDDPLTTGQVAREILFGFDSLGGDLKGYVNFIFNGEKVMLDANAVKLNDDRCSTLLSAIPNVEKAVCQRITPITESGGANYSIAFEAWPIQPYENNLYPNSGNPPLSSFSCDTNLVEVEDGDVACYLQDLVTTNIKEYVECSNHGGCDRVTGKCVCELGFHGPACDDITDSGDQAVVEADGPFFTGNLVKLTTRKAPSRDFNLIKTEVATEEIFTIKGNGDVQLHRGTLFVEHGGQVVEGGVLIGSGGLEIQDDGLEVLSQSPASVGILASGTKEFQGSVLRMYAAAAPSSNYSFIRAMAGDGKRPVFEVKGDGETELQGRLRVESGGILVSSGPTFLNQGAEVEGGMRVGGGVAVTSGGMAIASDREDAPAVLISYGRERGNILEAESLGSSVLEVAASGKVTVRSGGVKVESGGVVIESGGQEIHSGGLTVDGGIHVKSGGLQLDETALRLVNSVLSCRHDLEGQASISGHASSPYFSGNLMELSADRGSSKDYNFIRCSSSNGTVTFKVSGAGDIVSHGGISAQGDAHLGGDVLLGSRAMLGKSTVMAGAKILVEAASSFVEIMDDGVEEVNALVLQEEGAQEGQVLIVKNGDQQPTSGALIIPPGVSFLFVFDGKQWVELGVREAAVTALHGVTHLHAAEHLDIGDYSFTARTLIASGQVPGRVAFFGSGGVLSANKNMVVNDELGLQVNKLTAQEIGGAMDFKGNKLKNAVIVGSVLEGAHSFSTQRLFIDGSPEGSLAAFGPKGAVLPTQGVSVDSAGSLHTQGLSIEGSPEGAMVTFGPGGSLLPARGVNMGNDGALTASKLVIPGSSEGSMMAFGPEGSVRPASGVKVSSDGGIITRGLAIEGMVEGAVATFGPGGKVMPAQGMTIGADGAITAPRIHIEGSPEGALASFGARGSVVPIQGVGITPDGTFTTERLSTSHLLIKGSTAGGLASFGLNGEVVPVKGVSVGADGSFQAPRLFVEGGSSDVGALLTFGPKGEVLPAKGVSLEANGGFHCPTVEAQRIQTSQLVGTIDASGAELRGVSLKGASLSAIDSIEASKLQLSALGGSIDASAATVNGLTVKGGAMTSLASVQTGRLQTTTLEGRINASHAELHDVSLRGASMTAATSIGTTSLVVEDWKDSAGQVPIFGADGGLTSSSVLRFNEATGTLKFGRLEVHEIVNIERLLPQGSMDGRVLHNVTISGGRLEDIKMLVVEDMEIKGAATIDGEAFIQGSLTVSGTVMGSGPYVDTSDGRFKEEVEDMDHPLDTLASLHGVKYRFKEEPRLRRHLQGGLQMGFIAQEVEEVLPELVHTDEQGFKYVAYGKVVPLLVEAVKELRSQVEGLERRVGGRDGVVEKSSSSSSSSSSIGERPGHSGDWVMEERLRELEQENALLHRELQSAESRLRAIETRLGL